MALNAVEPTRLTGCAPEGKYSLLVEFYWYANAKKD